MEIITFYLATAIVLFLVSPKLEPTVSRQQFVKVPQARGKDASPFYNGGLDKE